MVEKRTAADAETVQLAPGVTITKLAEGARLQGQLVEMQPSSRVPAHSHPNEQLTYLVSGQLRLLIDETPVQLEPGESVLIPSEANHAAVTEAEASAVAFDVFSPPRDGLPSVD